MKRRGRSASEAGPIQPRRRRTSDRASRDRGGRAAAVLPFVLGALVAGSAAAAGQERQATAEGDAQPGREASARLVTSGRGPVLSSVSSLRVHVRPVADDSLAIRLAWEPPSHGAAPERYEAFLARVSVPHRLELGRTTTRASGTEFRIARNPADLDCCPVVDGGAVYMDGPGAGAWDTYPDGPYAQLLTAGVVPLAADGERGVLVTRQLDPEAVLRESAGIAAGGETDAAAPPGEAADRLPGAAPGEGQEGPPEDEREPSEEGPPEREGPADPWLYIGIALLAVLVVIAAAARFFRERRG